MEEDPLALETRRRLYLLVLQNPGTSARDVQRGAQLAWGETAYHLERLEQGGLVHRERGGRQDFYFAASVPLADRTLLRLARSPTIRRLLVTLLRDRTSSFQGLCERTGLSQSRISVHLRRLLELGIVESNRREQFRVYSIRDEVRVVRLLIAYRESYADGWVDKLVDAWSELFPPG